jgi:2-keto-4-pentenoate hydratase/2-oxohepta-3-ene-1,7-dioic acid hydratase in catechol pathway
MKLFRFGEKDKERPGLLLREGSMIDVSIFGEDYDEKFFGTRGLRRLARWASVFASSQPRIDPTAVRLGSPIARPSKIVAVGLNYQDHAKEAKLELPQEPVLFSKASSAMAGPYDDLVIPRGANKVDWEVELGVVIGARTKSIPESRGLDTIAGFLVVNDYSERSFQLERGGQWFKGKSADGFAPLGPYLVTPDEVPNVQNLKLSLLVNGKPMQNGTTANMLFSVAHLVAYSSHFMTLLPGDVVSTGTPAGVGLGKKPPRFLKPGDVVEATIEGLGTQRQRVVAPNR